jgi:hypothetical protein
MDIYVPSHSDVRVVKRRATLSCRLRQKVILKEGAEGPGRKEGRSPSFSIAA